MAFVAAKPSAEKPLNMPRAELASGPGSPLPQRWQVFSSIAFNAPQ
jgi:hypothetical protein